MIRDRKGRFSPTRDPLITAERGLLSHVRAILFTFGSEVSEGSATKHGTALAFRTRETNMAQTLRAALAPAIPPGRTLEIRSHVDPLRRCQCYLIHVLPVGGPRAVQTEAAA